MSTAIDTNILLDILLNDKDFYEKSKSLIENYFEIGALIISPVVYSELLTQFIKKSVDKGEQDLNKFLTDLGIIMVNFTNEDLVLAARSWLKYVEKTKSKEIFCVKCGERNDFVCKKCNAKISWRNHIITDFLVGSHAQNHAEIFLTRDKGFYKNYFSVKIEN